MARVFCAGKAPMVQQKGVTLSTSVSMAQPRPHIVQKIASMAASVAVSTAFLAGSASAAGVNFTTPANNAVLESPVHVEMAVSGMQLRPAADGLIPNSGHFHVNIDTGSSPEGDSIPFDKSHLHFGKAQTAADIQLTPGEHTLTLQFANALHESYGPTYASSITINVQ